ncbi:LAME_0G04346g1_1 [Lachancea meyersii CBS 8951]|uniref:LAME_0G04346g1_1 n=1 Tax=Lachancea meyersii CBS 8951 TaxID=1266667 RepID=A0A1G4K6Y8_9SACH|nr:LAME_0G04346g1_1 [Lachancea meyersii CBS 8951]
MGRFIKHWQLFRLFLKTNKLQLIKTYILVPVGGTLTLCILYGVDRFIRNVIKVTFPASVAVMLINFGFMCSLSAWRRPYADIYVKVIDIPLSWSLRWMNLFFTPAFVVLPLSPWISWQEALLIVAVFVIGYVVSFVILAYITIVGQKLFGSRKFISIFVRQEEIDNGMEAGSSFTPAARMHRKSSSTASMISPTEPGIPNKSEVSYESDAGLSDIASNSGYVAKKPVRGGNPLNSPESDILMSPIDSTGAIDLAHRRQDDSETTGPTKRGHIQTPEPTYFNRSSTNTIIAMRENDPAVCKRAVTKQESENLSLEFDKVYAVNMWQCHLHHILYGLGFIASVFSYYFSWYAMPFQFFTAVTTFMFVVDNPFVKNPKYKKLLHPVICSVALTWIVLLVSVMIKHRAINYYLSDLRSYKTGRTYLKLFNNAAFAHHVWPGAGDVFSTCMDISIVGLSLPMYTHRYDLRRHFLSMIPPILLLCAGSLTLYPLICYHIGIASDMSIGFIGRSITLALGTPTIQNLNGSVTLMAVTTVVSGIMGVLTGGLLLDLLRVPEDDYVTRGLTLGCNCGAIATAYLLGVDRRAAAISTLSFSLFGAFMVVLSAVSKIKDFVQTLVGN